MSSITSDWQFTERWLGESAPVAAARVRAEELGITCPTAATGATLAMLARTSNAQNVVEVGASGGVSGLWIRSGASDAMLTTIEEELDHVEAAKAAYKQAGVPSNRSRFIPGRPADALPKLADATYDLVLLDGSAHLTTATLTEARRIVKAQGLIVILHALLAGTVADPVARGEDTLAMREIFDAVADIEGSAPALLPVGDGVLVIAG